MTTLATMTERQSWEEFEHSASIQPLNPRATTAGDSVATAATGFEGSFRLQSFNRFGSMERAPKVCLFACISSSRDRMKFKLHFDFQTITPTSHPFGPIVVGRRMEEGGCECHVRRRVVPFQRGMRELAFRFIFIRNVHLFVLAPALISTPPSNSALY